MVPFHPDLAKKLTLAALLLLAGCTWVRAESRDDILTAWLNNQTNVQSFSADFVQVRRLKTISQPLSATGHVWFAAPNRFHWELGSPPQTIALRQPEQMLVIYPRLKRVEKYPLTGAAAGPWRDTLALLEAGFPRNRAELDRQFTLVSQTVSNNVCNLVLQPRSAAARRLMPKFKIDFTTTNLLLRATELEFTDGSTMRNEFASPVLNQPVDPKLFAPDLPSDFTVVEPLKKSP